MEGQPDTTPLPPVPPGFETDRPPPGYRPLLLLPERIWHGHPLRLALRAIIAAVLSLVVLALIPGSRRRARRRVRAGLVVRADGPVGPGPAAGPLTVKGVGGWCRVVRFFTHLPGAGPSPGKSGGPGRTHKGRARRPGLARRAYGPPAMPGPAPARTPAKQPPAAPRRIQRPAVPMPRERKDTVAEMQNSQEKHAGNSPGIAGNGRVISYN